MQSLKTNTAERPHIVNMGGGTGSPIISQAEIKAGYDNLTAICASMDSGGRTGRKIIEERGMVISIGDVWRNLFLGLIHPEDNHRMPVDTFMQMANFTDGRQQNVGYALGYALLEMHNGDYLGVQQFLERLLQIKFKGIAIPVTPEPTNLYFQTEGGEIFKGEHLLDEERRSEEMITRLWIDPPVNAHPKAIAAIEDATHIIYSPGSFPGSLLSCFFPNGIREALAETQAMKILVTNLFSERHITHQFTPMDFKNKLVEYTGLPKPFEMMIIPHLSREEFEIEYPVLTTHYQRKDHSHFLGWSDRELEPIRDLGVEVVRVDIFSLVSDQRVIRHDSDKLAGVFKELITGNINMRVKIPSLSTQQVV